MDAFGHETFDHTADIGIRIRAADLPSLFRMAGEALTGLLVEDPTTIRETQRIEVHIEEEDLPFLLFDWLARLHRAFEIEGLLLCRFEVQETPTGLEALAWGEPMDLSRHPLSHEVKAITYHGLRLDRIDGGWEAEVIVDI